MSNNLTDHQVAILNIIREAGVSGFMAALNGINYDQLCEADPQIQAEEDEDGFDPAEVWADACDNLYEAAESLIDSSNDH